jgi:hypothetical protein
MGKSPVLKILEVKSLSNAPNSTRFYIYVSTDFLKWIFSILDLFYCMRYSLIYNCVNFTWGLCNAIVALLIKACKKVH